MNNNTQWGNFRSDDVDGISEIYRLLKKLEVAINAGFQGNSGWTDGGTSVALTTATDTVQIQSQLTVGGNATAAGKILFLEDTDNGSNSITISAPSAISSDTVITLPNTTGTLYITGGTDVALADGGTGASLSDPNADRIMFWDDSAGSVTWLNPNNGLSVTGTSLSTDQKTYMMAYNGQNAASPGQRIGLAYSYDGNRFIKSPRNPIIPLGSGGSFDDDHHAQPCLVEAAGVLYIFYSAYDGSNYTIGMAYSLDKGITWTKHGQILTLGAGGTWDDAGVYLPFVMYDPDDADATRRWKMWYTGFDGVQTYQLGYAYASAAFGTWTKYASNPVLSPGSSTWDDDYAGGTASVIKVDSTYYIIYSGGTSPFNTFSIGVASFTNPESTYTKYGGNPVISPRTTATQALTANAASGSTTISVGDTSVFQVNEPVLLWSTSSGTNDELNRIKSINSSTSITLWNATTNTYNTANSATIASVYLAKLTPNCVVKKNGGIKVYCSAFGTISGRQREFSVVLNATSPIGTWTFDYDSGVVLPGYETSAWDRTSIENPSVIESPFSEELYSMRYGANPLVKNAGVNITPTPSSWGTTTSSIQVGTDGAIIDYAAGGQSFSSNLAFNGSAYTYLNSRAAATVQVGTYGGETGSIAFGFAPSGTAGNTATVTTKFGCSNTGNVFIGSNLNSMSTPTGSPVGTLNMLNSTAPSAVPADQFCMYAKDFTAGNSCPTFMTENDTEIQLNQNLTTTSSPTFVNTTVTQVIATGKTIDTTAGDSATIDAIAGRFRKDTSGAVFTLTNNKITANSIIILTGANAAADATATSWNVSAGNGSATITFNAAPTANFDMNFLVIN